MKARQKNLAKKELEKIYDNHFKLLRVGKDLQKKFSASLHENPVLGLILKLAIAANVGIWASFVLMIFNQF